MNIYVYEEMSIHFSWRQSTAFSFSLHAPSSSPTVCLCDDSVSFRTHSLSAARAAFLLSISMFIVQILLITLQKWKDSIIIQIIRRTTIEMQPMASLLTARLQYNICGKKTSAGNYFRSIFVIKKTQRTHNECKQNLPDICFRLEYKIAAHVRDARRYIDSDGDDGRKEEAKEIMFCLVYRPYRRGQQVHCGPKMIGKQKICK